jgi:hypothetical protein
MCYRMHREGHLTWTSILRMYLRMRDLTTHMIPSRTLNLSQRRWAECSRLRCPRLVGRKSAPMKANGSRSRTGACRPCSQVSCFLAD